MSSFVSFLPSCVDREISEHPADVDEDSNTDTCGRGLSYDYIFALYLRTILIIYSRISVCKALLN